MMPSSLNNSLIQQSARMACQAGGTSQLDQSHSTRARSSASWTESSLSMSDVSTDYLFSNITRIRNRIRTGHIDESCSKSFYLQVLCLCPIIFELFHLLAIFIIHIQKFEMRTITIQSLKLCHHLHPRRCLACRHPRHKSQLGTRNTRTQRRCCRFWIRTWTIRITRTWVIVTQVSPRLPSADLSNCFF